jgi:hypothetical protein
VIARVAPSAYQFLGRNYQVRDQFFGRNYQDRGWQRVHLKSIAKGNPARPERKDAVFKTTLKATVAASTLLIAATVANFAHADQSMFDQGSQARGQWEQWFNSLPGGDYKTGAFFWASQRSLPNPQTCKQMNDEFYKGCTEAKLKLAPSDALRKTEPDFKTGWNAWTANATPPAPQPTLAPAAAASAPQPAPAAAAPAPQAPTVIVNVAPAAAPAAPAAAPAAPAAAPAAPAPTPTSAAPAAEPAQPAPTTPPVWKERPIITTGSSTPAAAPIPAPAQPAPTASFGFRDLDSIVDASRNNEARFNRDYKGRAFSDAGVLHSVDEPSWFSGGKNKIEVEAMNASRFLPRTVYCFQKLDSSETANWPSRMPIKITGTIHDTVTGDVWLEDCQIKPG